MSLETGQNAALNFGGPPHRVESFGSRPFSATELPVRLFPNHFRGSVASELSADPGITSPLESGVTFLDFALSEQAKMSHIDSLVHFSPA